MVMNQQEEVFEDTLSDFRHNIKRWKSLIKHMENEVVFLDRLLNAEAINAFTTRTMGERRNLFKKMVKVKAEMLVDFKHEVAKHETVLSKLMATKQMPMDSSYVAQHEAFKVRIEKYRKDFDAFRSKVLLQAGSVL
jgi:hypothetical protein